jgi:hypothetical protein
MPEKEKKGKSVVGTPEGAAAAREAREAARSKDVFVYVKESEKKLAPQAAGIVNILKEAGKRGLTRVDLVTAMKGVITTRQPEGRILSYYQKSLVDCGAVEIRQNSAE